MEEILVNISASLVAPKDINQVINSALAQIGKHLGLSRVYMVEVNLSNNLINNTHEWCAEGISPRQLNIYNIPQLR